MPQQKELENSLNQLKFQTRGRLHSAAIPWTTHVNYVRLTQICQRACFLPVLSEHWGSSILIHKNLSLHCPTKIHFTMSIMNTWDDVGVASERPNKLPGDDLTRPMNIEHAKVRETWSSWLVGSPTSVVRQQVLFWSFFCQLTKHHPGFVRHIFEYGPKKYTKVSMLL